MPFFSEAQDAMHLVSWQHHATVLMLALGFQQAEQQTNMPASLVAQADTHSHAQNGLFSPDLLAVGVGPLVPATDSRCGPD
jgi:hypothetical protein